MIEILGAINYALTSTKDAFTTIFYAVTTIVAVLGFNAWKRQLKAKDRYETAHRLLKSVCNVRDAVSHVRRAFISEKELQEAVRKNGLLEEGIIRVGSDRTKLAYESRWEFVRSALLELNPAVIEMEMICGSSLRKLISELREHVGCLRLAIDNHLECLSDNLKLDPAERRRVINTLMIVSEDSDEYGRDMNAIIEKIKKKLEPFLSLT